MMFPADLNPIIAQLASADGNRARADILLRCPDAVMLKYQSAMTEICDRVGFHAGVVLIVTRCTAMMAVRDGAGLLPDKTARMLEELRGGLARYAANAGALPPG